MLNELNKNMKKNKRQSKFKTFNYKLMKIE